ncbi:aromatic amino acid aminotransferase [Tetragenococcus halophilus subsp. halophilus]|nr:pyridoxal phosphate-dependent aminotransferase [Tetragenococcus halophilus]NWN98974.1 pyridoxal phosphate-dependent aminotransferase [Tetragenococcus halophilus]RQD29262.1 pyridoxal phosphate-dependent aminotransferase [Tetragenococcus halophilus subsp. halophilus DSM 20339]WJS81406.1 pyridoxal phosphate-dependent aminotransferase [Tetragenococcus halophilus]GBD58811.1 aromatic amino acid aminotransferase [Tetragenococcus halophilus subsp. halophilus]GBD62131.1 aromatic amino acid aminotran
MADVSQRFNPRLDQIAVSMIRQFDERVSTIPNILKLTLGEPDFNTPEHVKEAGINAIKENYSHYTGMSGVAQLRKAAARFVHDKYNLSYDFQSEVLVSVGVTEGIAASLISVLEAGDKVIVPSPIFPGYEPIITLTGAQPIYIDTSVNDFILSPEVLEETLQKYGDEIKAIVLNYPSNPTGVTYSRGEVKAIADVLRKYSVFVISDEVYSELTYEGEHVSIAEYLREQTILLNGLSKSHAMTGWRLGLIFAPEELTKQIIKTHQYLVTSAVTSAQLAAVNALTDGFDDALPMKEEYRKRRDFVYGELHRLGYEVAKPTGAFYIFAKIPEGYIKNSMEFCVDLAEKESLAIIPGAAFGVGGEGYVRLSYAASMQDLEEAMKRIEHYMQNNKVA